MEPVLKIENLSKKYILNHQAQERYVALRDVITNKAKSVLGSKKEKVPKYSEEFWALKDVAFEVNQGDRVGIIGRNGAGKSTLLKIISQITEPTTGKITINGRVASLLEVGTGFHPELTGRENIFLNGSIMGMSKKEIQSKFDEIVAFSEVEKFLDTPVKRYSSGMYVRLAFSVAAHLEPDILIVDEVLAVGDVAFQKKCLGKMEEVSGHGRTILFVSHNMQAIQKICTKSVLLKYGKIIAIGDTDSVIEEYLNTNTNNQSVYEIESLENESTMPGFITRVQFEDLNGTPVNEIPIGRAWQARITLKLNRKVEHFITGLGLVTQFELPVCTSWTTPKDLEAGEYEVLFTNEDIMVTRGIYNIVIGLSENKVAFQYLDKGISLHISDVSDLVKEERIVNTESGLLINQMKAKIIRK